MEPIDYATSGMEMRQAMVDHIERNPNKSVRTSYILWNGIPIQPYDWISVPKEGRVRLTFLHSDPAVEQGVNIKVNGWLTLAEGERVPLLGTWKDDDYEDTVEYPYYSRDGLLCVYNVYMMVYPAGQVVEQRWTGNAGFWIEKLTEHSRVYHCSHAMSDPPDFNNLIFRIDINPEDSIEP